MSIALLIARVVFGVSLAAHGAQKLFGWFGGYGLAGTGGYFEQLGFRPGRRFALVAGLGEFVGGLLLALGFLGPVGPALMIAVMIVAMRTVHVGHGFFATTNGLELPLLYATAALALALAGPGRYSVDYALGLGWLSARRYVAIAVAIGILGAIGALLMRRPAAAPRAASA
jgi:putative oxidoreductase